MSNSRLEKFIYAICSMEVSDLPAPLSRIEILWNCLITGETPDFEPLSRNEKYLMAMLDRYDISNLPAPMSRGEKLLYKIAVGETDLSDVPGYLSRYEELLKYLIENGVLSDFEYVLYTLNQSLSTLYATVEKPVKSAILKGQTLVNLASNSTAKFLISGGECVKDVNGFFTLDSENKFTNSSGYYQIIFNYPYEYNKDYTVFAFVTENTLNEKFIDYGIWGSTLNIDAGMTGVFVKKINANYDDNIFRASLSPTSTGKIKIGFVLLEGDYTNVDIPYFDGMQSVKMPVLTTTGKNWIDIRKSVDGFLADSRPYDIAIPDNFDKTSDYTRVEPNTTYCYSVETPFDGTHVSRWFFYKDIGVVSSEVSVRKMASGVTKMVITTPSDCNYIRICSRGLMLDGATAQLEKSPTPTTHEPYKSNILTVNEPIELRGIGDVRDTLDLLTGELVQRIKETTLDGNESWQYTATFGDYMRFRLKLNDCKMENYNFIMENMPFIDDSNLGSFHYSVDRYGGYLFVFLNKTELSSQDEVGCKQYFQTHPTKLQYELSTESIKTVDLTIVDQDGQPTKLKTFNDITYVEMNADNIIPSINVEVATKISETLATLDPQQNDISNTQNELGQTIDEQTENTDATMMATTEIYEQTL